MEISEVPLASLHPWPSNARLHDERNIKAIRASLREFGQVEPIVVQKSSMGIIGGNGRLEAMQAEGWTKAKVYVLEIDDVRANALSLALNRAAELAAWDVPQLNQTMMDLAAADFPVTMFDFTPEDLGAIDAEDVADPGSGGGEPQSVKCPECGHVFCP